MGIPIYYLTQKGEGENSPPVVSKSPYRWFCGLPPTPSLDFFSSLVSRIRGRPSPREGGWQAVATEGDEHEHVEMSEQFRIS